ncbi:hypothetical protein ABFS83_05G125300 [Erythranthe nasuta]
MAIRRKKITVANKTRHVIGLCACFHGEDSQPSTFKRVIHPNRCTRFRPDVFLDLTIKWKLFTVVCLYVDGVRLPESMDHRVFLDKKYAVVDLGDDGSVKLSFPQTADIDEGGFVPFFFRGSSSYSAGSSTAAAAAAAHRVKILWCVISDPKVRSSGGPRL